MKVTWTCNAPMHRLEAQRTLQDEEALDELCRIAHEVRIFPTLTYNADPSPFLSSILEHLEKAGRKVSMKVVPYEFQRGGNLTLKVSDGLVL